MKKVRSRGIIPPEYKKGIIASCVMVAVLVAGIVLTLFAVRWKQSTVAPEKTDEIKGQMMSVLPGWEWYNTNVEWSDEIQTTSDAFINEAPPGTLEYRTETHYEDIKKIQYNYKRYHYKENGEDVYTYTDAHGGGEWEYNILAYELKKGGVYENRQTRIDENGGIWFKAGVNSESELTKNTTETVISSPYTVYFFKRATYSYDFFRWGGYSSWSFTKPVENDDIQIETRTVYKVEL